MLHDLLNILLHHTYFYEPVKLNVNIYDTLQSFVSYRCFVRIFADPRLPVALSMYSPYTDKVWQNLNTTLDPFHTYGTRIVSWTLFCQTCNIYLEYHQRLHQEKKFYTGHNLIVCPRTKPCGPRLLLYIISNIYMLPTALVTLFMIHPLIIFLLLHYNHQDLGLTVSNIIFTTPHPTFHIPASNTSLVSLWKIPKCLFANLLWGIYAPLNKLMLSQYYLMVNSCLWVSKICFRFFLTCMVRPI